VLGQLVGVVDFRGEPGRQNGQNLGEGQVIGGRNSSRMRSERYTEEVLDAYWE
jgi:hypothetical protein